MKDSNPPRRFEYVIKPREYALIYEGDYLIGSVNSGDFRVDEYLRLSIDAWKELISVVEAASIALSESFSESLENEFWPGETVRVVRTYEDDSSCTIDGELATYVRPAFYGEDFTGKDEFNHIVTVGESTFEWAVFEIEKVSE